MNTHAKLLIHAASILAVTAATRANVVIAEFEDIGEFSYAVDYMPDLDQKRGEYPPEANFGKAHCVPASAMNLLGYAANFGFPELVPGPGVWEGTEDHAQMTCWIGLLGMAMGTDGNSGTDLGGQDTGLNAWLDASDLGAMSVVTIARSGDYWPNIDTGAFMATAGAVVNFAYGRYDFTVGFQGTPFLLKRAQGHSVTLQRAVADNGFLYGSREVGFRNPSRPDDGDLYSNAPYTTIHMESAANIDVAHDFDKDGVAQYHNVTALSTPMPVTDRLRIIDSVTGLYPPGGMSYSQVQVSAQFAGGGLGFVGNKAPSTYAIEQGAQFVSVIPHPELHSGLAIVRSRAGTSLVQLPHGGKRSLRLLDLPTASRFLVAGPNHDAFVVTPTGIVVVETAFQSGARVGGSAFPTALRSLSIEAGAYDPATDELLLISGTGLQLFVLDGGTLTLKATHPLPAANRAAVRSMAVSGREPGRILLAFDDGKVGDLRLGAPGTTDTATSISNRDVRSATLSLPSLKGVRDPISVDLDGGGRLYVADSRNGLLEFIDEPGKGWVPAPHPYYAGTQAAGQKFSVFKSRNNLVRGLHDQPEWRNDIDEFE